MLVRQGKLSARIAGVLDPLAILCLFSAMMLIRFGHLYRWGDFAQGVCMGFALSFGTASLIYKIFGPGPERS